MAHYTLLKSDDTPASGAAASTQRSTARRVLVALAVLAGTAALSLYYASPLRPGAGNVADPSTWLSDPASGPDAEPLKQCVSGLPPPASAPAPTNPWASLTVPETVAVADWLAAPARGLNLTAGDRATLSDNLIYHIGAYRPRKDDALAYLADPARGAPERYARVTIHHSAQADPVVRDWLVGPLPVGEATTMRQLTEIYHRADIPHSARGFTTLWEIAPFLQKIMPPLAEATQELFDGVAVGLPNDTLVAGMIAPLSNDGAFRRTWINWRRNVAGPYLHPVGFFQYVDITGTDPAQWKLLKIVYNHQVFAGTDDFLAAFHNGSLKRLPPRPDQRTDLAWSTRARPAGPPRDLDELPGPRAVSFAGLRFRVDRELQYVSWMGWGMYLGFDRDMGLSLWDIRFKDERIIYELAPQEAVAQYAGNDPMQSSTAWLDRFFGMGASVRDMLPGYDCPHEAVYLPATTHSYAGSLTRQRAICIFEHDSGRPITRHMGYMPGEFGAVKGYELVVRSISTVGNYDYLFDYIFHFDGTIEVRLSASGYLQAGFWEPSQEAYGTAIRDTTMGSLHDHVVNYKVDLDVAGRENSLLFTSTAQEEVAQPWFDDDWGATVTQQRISRRILASENDALLRFPRNFQGGYALVNTAARNRWGAPRGYAVHPGYSPVYNTVVGSPRMKENANWARYNLAVSLRKESEPSSSSMWNLNLPGAPVVDFHRFFDGENITQQDLVAWINVGMHHLPQAEDAPNTRTNVAASSFFLTPLNYFDADASMDGANAILLSPPLGPADPWAAEDYGVRPVRCVPGAVPPFEYAGVEAFGLRGERLAGRGAEEVRREGELFHRIKLEL